MGQKELSLLLKLVVVVLAVFLTLAMAFFVPPLGYEVYLYYEDVNVSFANVLGGIATPAVIFLSAIPCYAALFLAWRIFSEIGKNNSFCAENARRLRVISRLALTDTIVYLVLSAVLCAVGIGHPSIVLILAAVILFGAAVTICAAALSHLTQKAADLKSDNDLTI